MAFNCLDPNQVVKVEVSYVEPSFSASYLDVETLVSYVEPSFAISYLDVKICAAVSFPDVLAVDIVTPTDLVTLDTTKSLTDTYSGFEDTAIRSFVKASTDSVTMTDDIDIDFFLQKFLSENQPLTDTKAYQLVKLLFDSMSPADAAQLTAVKNIADIVNIPADSVVYAIDKGLQESTTLSDFITTTLIFIRTFSESLTASDSANIASALDKSENLASTDAQAISTDKSFSEGLNLLDNMDGDIEYVFIKLVSELLVTSDAQAVDFASNKSDNAVLSSSGFLYMQDYCDITYFLEDYVGQTRTFT